VRRRSAAAGLQVRRFYTPAGARSIAGCRIPLSGRARRIGLSRGFAGAGPCAPDRGCRRTGSRIRFPRPPCVH